MRSIIVPALLALAVWGCRAGVPAASSALPYYDSQELTPRWSPVAHRIADFALTTQTGGTIDATSLRGKIHVASFVYTRCSVLCPMVVRELGTVAKAVAGMPDVVLVSYSVTPDVDTPASLAEYGRERGVDPRRWLLVTGDQRTIWRLARDSYFADDRRTLAGHPTPGEAFLHTEKVLLVDRDLHVRGVYNGTAAFDLERLVADVRLLAAGSTSRRREIEPRAPRAGAGAT